MSTSPSHNRSILLSKFNESQSQLVVQTADLPLGTLAEMVDSQAIDLEPGFQRRERWSHERQSALIESFLLNVPVPPVYLAEESEGTYTAIDGKQRLKAITDFIKNRFPLRNLERLTEAEGFQFQDLPPAIANSLKIRPSLRVVTLLKQTNSTLKYEVFLRLNKGGEVLNAQEIRNVAFRGRLNDALYRLAENEILRRQLKITSNSSSAYKTMSDAEYVLRFLTLNETYENFSGAFADEMNSFMERNQEASEETIQGFESEFTVAISRCNQLWGAHVFHRTDGDGWRGQFLAGMYDAQMVAVLELTEAQFTQAAENLNRVEANTRALFADPQFEKSVRTGTNTPSRIRYRIRRVAEMLQAL